MNIKKTLVISVAGMAVSSLALNKLHKEIYERFPNTDRKVLRKAFNKFFLDALTGRTEVPGHATDEEMDAIFLKYVRKYEARSN